MRILLYNDNGVTHNFIPHLWMFLLQALTPPGHEVVLIDGKTFRDSGTGLCHVFMTRRIGPNPPFRVGIEAHRNQDGAFFDTGGYLWQIVQEP